MKMMKSLLLLSLTSLLLVSGLYANTDVAKVIILKGEAKAKLADGSIVDVKLNHSLPEGTVLQTAEKSFVKLLFIDKSQMNLGPNSQMIIDAFPKKEAGIITLVKGQIRSQVTKDYMEMENKNKSKLYIKTKTAAMGIRGTDFQVNYNPKNQNTSLITFEGSVALSHIGKDFKGRLSQNQLENFVSGNSAVLVKQGQVSAINLNIASKAMLPTKLNFNQISALEKNESGIVESKESSKADNQYRNPIPPGVDGASFSNNTHDKFEGINLAKDLRESSSGFFNSEDGTYKLPAGTAIDLETVNLIPPPTDAVFDTNSGTYLIPDNFGTVNAEGQYVPPTGYNMGDDGNLKKTEIPTQEKAPNSTESERAPASTSAEAPAPSFFGSTAQNFINQNAVNVDPNQKTEAKPHLNNVAQEIIQKNTQQKETINNTRTNVKNSRVKFIFNRN